MMNNAKPETIGGFLLGNFLKPIVSEGMSRLSDGLMNALFPTKKTQTGGSDTGVAKVSANIDYDNPVEEFDRINGKGFPKLANNFLFK